MAWVSTDLPALGELQENWSKDSDNPGSQAQARSWGRLRTVALTKTFKRMHQRRIGTGPVEKKNTSGKTSGPSVNLGRWEGQTNLGGPWETPIPRGENGERGPFLKKVWLEAPEKPNKAV